MKLLKKLLCAAACVTVLSSFSAAGMFSLTAAAQAEMFEHSAVDGEWLETGDPLTHRFRDSSGKVTEFSLVKDGKRYLYINGEPAKRADTPVKSAESGKLFGYLIDGRIFPFRLYYSDGYYSRDEIYLVDYLIFPEYLEIYDPMSGELIANISVRSGKVSEVGYIYNGNVQDVSDYKAKYILDENGYIESSLPGPRVTDFKTGEGSVTLSFENVIVEPDYANYVREPVEHKDYAVSYRKKGDTEFIPAPAPKNNKATITGLEKRAEYTIRITTVVKSGGITYLQGHTDTDVFMSDKAIVDGWNDINGKKKYAVDGKLVCEKLMTIDGKLYYFDKSGNLAQKGYITLDDKQYYVNDDGTVAVSTFLSNDHKNGKFTLADRNGVVTTFYFNYNSFFKYYSLARNAEEADKEYSWDDKEYVDVSLDELIGRDTDDIIEALDLEEGSRAGNRPFIILGGRIYSFNGNAYLDLVTPADAVGREGILYDAATGECLGVCKFSSKKTLNSDKKYLYSGTLTMVGSGIKYTIASNGELSVFQLEAPGSLECETTVDKVKLMWKEVKGADSYNVYLYDSKSKEYKLFKNVKDTNCIIPDLKKSTTYKFRVAGVVSVPGSGLEQKPADISAKTASKKLDGIVKKGSDKFFYRDGLKVRNEVVKVSGKYYGFDSSGKMIKNKTCEIGGYTYKFGKTGTAVTNDWTYKGTKIASYIGKDGKFTTYDFSGNYLEINGKIATPEDFKKLGSGTKTVRFGKLYYTLDFYIYVNSTTTPLGKSDVYDVLTGKVVDTIVTGLYFNKSAMDRTVLDEGSVYSLKTGTIYKFNNHEIKTKTKASSPLIICKNFSGTNSVGGLDTTIDFYNNSSKSIKYIKVNVSAMNRVNDTVSCDIQRKSSFNLLYTGPLAANSYDGALWEAYMYNYSADHARINSITITYMDGTTKTLSAGQFIDIS